MDRKKLVFKRETVKSLTSGELARARGAGTTKGDSGGCTDSHSGCSTIQDTGCESTSIAFSCDISNQIRCNTNLGGCW